MKKAIGIGAAALLFLGIANLPIGYYTFLRIAVTIAAVLFAYWFGQEERYIGTVAFSTIAVLFNPILPVYLHSKIVWMVIDGGCGLGFLIAGFWKETE